MIVCVCKVVSDSTVRKAVEAGARTISEVGRACGAGQGCGNCVRNVAQIIDETIGAGATGAPPCKKAA